MIITATCTRIYRLSVWCVAPLTGKDGRLSWAKLVTGAVLALSALGRPLSAVVAVTCIAAAHGSKVLLALIDAKTVTATASDVRSDAHTVTEAITRVIQARDPVLGFDPSRPLPDPAADSLADGAHA